MMNMAQQLIDEAKKLLKEAGDENARLREALLTAQRHIWELNRLRGLDMPAVTDYITEALNQQTVLESDIDVGCGCGWRGKQSELMRPSVASRERRCPECSTIFERRSSF